MGTLEVDVYDLFSDRNGGALIICAPTGVFYTAQCGGMACTHPRAEGFALPIWELLPELGDGCPHGCSDLTKAGPSYDRPDLRQALAQLIDDGLTREFTKYTFSLRFDFDRIDELQEGWWPLKITGKINDCGPLDHRCYYHGGNCD